MIWLNYFNSLSLYFHRRFIHLGLENDPNLILVLLCILCVETMNKIVCLCGVQLVK